MSSREVGRLGAPQRPSLRAPVRRRQTQRSRRRPRRAIATPRCGAGIRRPARRPWRRSTPTSASLRRSRSCLRASLSLALAEASRARPALTLASPASIFASAAVSFAIPARSCAGSGRVAVGGVLPPGGTLPPGGAVPVGTVPPSGTGGRPPPAPSASIFASSVFKSASWAASFLRVDASCAAASLI